MKRIYMNVPDDTGCGYNRAKLPAKHCQEILLNEGIELLSPDRLDIRDEYDVYVFHRLVSPTFFPHLLRLRQQGKCIVWELDDNLFEIPLWSPARNSIGPHNLEALKICLEISDRIITSTEQLKEQLGHQHKTTVLPNLIDLDDWTMPSNYRGEPLVRILWAGSNTHQQDVAMLVPALREIILSHPEVQVILWGQQVDGLDDLAQVTFLPMVHRTAYPKLLQLLKPDIALCPLADIPFNHSKSNLKYLEMTMGGALTIASNVGPYAETIEHEEDGLLVGPDQWREAIESLIHSQDTKANCLWFNAQTKVRNDYSWQSAKRDLWLNFFREVA